MQEDVASCAELMGKILFIANLNGGAPRVISNRPGQARFNFVVAPPQRRELDPALK
jgi:hypothetical protein